MDRRLCCQGRSSRDESPGACGVTRTAIRPSPQGAGRRPAAVPADGQWSSSRGKGPEHGHHLGAPDLAQGLAEREPAAATLQALGPMLELLVHLDLVHLHAGGLAAPSIREATEVADDPTAHAGLFLGLAQGRGLGALAGFDAALGRNPLAGVATGHQKDLRRCGACLARASNRLARAPGYPLADPRRRNLPRAAPSMPACGAGGQEAGGRQAIGNQRHGPGPDALKMSQENQSHHVLEFDA